MCKGQGAKEYVFLRCCHIMSHIIGTRIRQRKLQKANLKKQQLCLATFQSKISCTSIRLWPATVLIHRLLLSLNWVQICVWNKKFGKFAWV